MSMLDPQTVDMFHFSGPKHTTPNCPVDMAPNFNPSSGAQSYSRSTKDCSRNSYYNIPFFLDRPKKYEEWSVNAHEARPGHHTQVRRPRLHSKLFIVLRTNTQFQCRFTLCKMLTQLLYQFHLLEFCTFVASGGSNAISALLTSSRECMASAYMD